MGRIFLVDCFLCKACRTQIASADDYIRLHTDYEIFGGLFQKAVNVLVDPPERYRTTWSHLVANVHCIKCCDYLGYKYIENHPFDTVIQPNMLKLIMSKLKKQVGDAYYDVSVPGSEDTSHLLYEF